MIRKTRNERIATWLPLLCALAVLGLAPAAAPAQHVHGVIELGVVVEGGTVAVSLDAPLSDVVGFEHAPESDDQLDRIRQAAAVLGNANAMFALADSARCEISATSIDGPAYLTQHLAEEDAGSAESHGHDHDSHHSHSAHDEHAGHDGHDHDSHHGHSAHDEHAGHDGHDHQESEQHAEVNASYEWACGNVSAVEALGLRFAESFTGIETIEIQILTSAGAHVLTADGRISSVPLSPP